ncbi:MAG: replicative DNA helicase [Clostridia bacterium]|nr:replicative DNA helicase [Clostridia bacterium]
MPTDVNANTMPHSIDAELALLGCLIIDNELQADIIESLTEEDFYLEAHKYVIKGMRQVFLNKKPVDIVTLSDELERTGELERAGGIAYITEITQTTPSSANYKYYLDIVKRDSMNRKLIRAARKIIENSMKGEEITQSLDFAEQQVYNLSKENEKSSLKSMAEGDIVDEVIHKFEEIKRDPNVLRGVETGFRQLDKMTNGLQNSDLIILAARPGMGKTSFAMNIVEHAAMQKGKVCAVFSLEMPRIQIVQRLLCSYAGVSMERALSGKLEQPEWKKLFLASDRLSKSKIYIDDSSRILPTEILSKCRRLSAQVGGLDLVMIDYIQLMGSISNGGSSESNRQQEIAAISRDLKLMAKELNVPVIALSQLRRIQTKEPQLSDLRESGAIEQDADIVMFINRPEATATAEELASGKIVKGAAELVIAKHRNGSQGRVQLRFIGESTKFVNVDDQNREDEPPVKVSHPREYDAPYASAPEEELPPVDQSHPANMVRAGEEEMPF